MNRLACGRLAAAAFLLLVLGAVAPARAGSTAVRPSLYITSIANVYGRGGDLDAFDTLALTAELTWYPALKPWYGGLFVDYRDSSSSRLDDNVNTGVYFRYNYPRWDATTWLFVNRAPESDPNWLSAARLRYRMGETWKIGIESLVPLDGSNTAKLMAGYYGSLGRSLSLNVLAGSFVGSGPDLAARIDLMWQVR